MPDKQLLESCRDRSTYSIADWEKLGNNVCPNCAASGQIYLFARGGVSENVRCNCCGAKYLTSPIREWGAKRIG